MDLKTHVHLEMPKVEGIWATALHDCPIGRIFDFACALQSFAMQRMADAQAAQKDAVKEEKPVEQV